MSGYWSDDKTYECDPVDDFARGPEVTPNVDDLGAQEMRTEILSVLRPLVAEAELVEVIPGADDEDYASIPVGMLRAAKDLYLKFGGVL